MIHQSSQFGELYYAIKISVYVGKFSDNLDIGNKHLLQQHKRLFAIEKNNFINSQLCDNTI